MSYNPEDFPQTHDPLGRKFTNPVPGGPVPGKLNLIVGEAKTGEVLVSLQRDDQSAESVPERPRASSEIWNP